MPRDAPQPSLAPVAATQEMPCIRCGDCAPACPVQLQPQHLLWLIRSEHLDAMALHGLTDCLECGACDQVCPSAIPLTAQLHLGKQRLAQHLQARAMADAARARHLARQQRQLRDQQTLAAALTVRQEQASSADAVAAALQRARAKRQRKDAPASQ